CQHSLVRGAEPRKPRRQRRWMATDYSLVKDRIRSSLEAPAFGLVSFCADSLRCDAGWGLSCGGKIDTPGSCEPGATSGANGRRHSRQWRRIYLSLATRFLFFYVRL